MVGPSDCAEIIAQCLVQLENSLTDGCPAKDASVDTTGIQCVYRFADSGCRGHSQGRSIGPALRHCPLRRRSAPALSEVEGSLASVALPRSVRAGKREYITCGARKAIISIHDPDDILIDLRKHIGLYITSCDAYPYTI